MACQTSHSASIIPLQIMICNVLLQRSDHGLVEENILFCTYHPSAKQFKRIFMKKFNIKFYGFHASFKSNMVNRYDIRSFMSSSCLLIQTPQSRCQTKGLCSNLHRRIILNIRSLADNLCSSYVLAPFLSLPRFPSLCHSHQCH